MERVSWIEFEDEFFVVLTFFLTVCSVVIDDIRNNFLPVVVSIIRPTVVKLPWGLFHMTGVDTEEVENNFWFGVFIIKR